MRKDLLRQYFRRLHQLFEHLPDVAAVHRPAGPGEMNTGAALDAAFGAVALQISDQGFGNLDDPVFSLVRDFRKTGLQAFQRDEPQIPHPQADGVEGLYQQFQPAVALFFRRLHQFLILLFGQLSVGGNKSLPLNLLIAELVQQ